jgi:hypothetical protein
MHSDASEGGRDTAPLVKYKGSHEHLSELNPVQRHIHSGVKERDARQRR